MLADGHAGASGVQQADRFIRQLTRRDITGRQADGGLYPFVQHLNAVVFFQHRGDAAHHQNGLRDIRLVHLHHLEATGQGRVFLDVFLVFGPCGRTDGAQSAAGQSRFQKVRRVARTGRATGPHKRVGFVHKHHDGSRAGLNLVNHLTQAVFKLALHRCAGLQKTNIQHQKAHVFQRWRYVTSGNPQGKAFDHCGFTDSRLTGQDWVVLATAHQDIDDLTNFFVSTDDRVDLSIARLFGHIGAELLQRFTLAHRAGGHRTRGFAGLGVPAYIGPILRRQGFLG